MSRRPLPSFDKPSEPALSSPLDRGSSGEKGYFRRMGSGSVNPPSEEPISGEADLRGGRGPKKWTTFVFRQSEVFLEYFTRDARGGLRFAGSLSLARLLWFPAAGPDAVTLELHLEGEVVELRPLDDAARWERAIRAWACHFRGVTAAELLAGPGGGQRGSVGKGGNMERKSVTRLFRRTVVDEETVGREGGGEVSSSPLPLPTLPALQAVFKKKSNKKEKKSGMTMMKTMTIGRRRKKMEEEECFRVGKTSDDWVAGFKMTRGKWESCVYRLAGGRLMCFESADDAAPVSFVELASVGQVSALGSTDRKKYAVEVECGGQKRLMGFESGETAESWTGRVREARDRAKEKRETATTERRRRETSFRMSLPLAGNVMADDSAAAACFEELQMFDGEEEAGGSALARESGRRADSDLASILEDLMEWETLDMTGMRNRFDTLQVMEREDVRKTILLTVSKNALKRDAADRARLALRLRMGLAKVIGREEREEEERGEEEEEEEERGDEEYEREEEEREEEREAELEEDGEVLLERGTEEFEELIFENDSEDAAPPSPPPMDYDDYNDTMPPPLEEAPDPPLLRVSLKRQQLMNKPK